MLSFKPVNAVSHILHDAVLYGQLLSPPNSLRLDHLDTSFRFVLTGIDH
jgi:hypothetical protein